MWQTAQQMNNSEVIFLDTGSCHMTMKRPHYLIRVQEATQDWKGEVKTRWGRRNCDLIEQVNLGTSQLTYSMDLTFDSNLCACSLIAVLVGGLALVDARVCQCGRGDGEGGRGAIARLELCLLVLRDSPQHHPSHWNTVWDAGNRYSLPFLHLTGWAHWDRSTPWGICMANTVICHS